MNINTSKLYRYLNYVHGLELEPDINLGDRNNENGILFLVEYIFLSQDNVYRLAYDFSNIVDKLEVSEGLYDRGSLDNQKQEQTGIPKRTISHDNISAIAAGSRFLRDVTNTKMISYHEEIANYGVKHFFSYNNREKGFRLPMNPGNYSIWLALANKFLLLQILFLPFYLINFNLTNKKPEQDTSGKLLNFVELYPLRRHWFWGRMYKRYLKQMKDLYGDRPLEKLTEIYFRDANHPVRLAAKEFNYDI